MTDPVRALRVVDDADVPEQVSMAEALEALVRKVLADGPIVASIQYERADGTVVVVSHPRSTVVARGLAAEAYALLHPDRDSA